MSSTREEDFLSEQSPSSDTPEQPDKNSRNRTPSEDTEGTESKRTSTGLSRKFVDVLGWLITGVWGASFILDAIIKTYDPPVSIHALMMVVAGAAFGSTLIKRDKE